MGITHTPRVFANIAKGLLKQSSNPETRAKLGLVVPHKYRSRVGLIDYAFGHLNNAAYLYHAEYARWTMMGENGWLNAMIKHRTLQVVVAQSCRYRAEIKPFFRQFEVESVLMGIEGSNMWFSQNFRNTAEGDDRVRAQAIVKCVFVKDRQVIDPREFLKDQVGIEPELVDAMHRNMSNDYDGEVMDCFERLDDAKRKAAAIIDGRSRDSREAR